MFGELTKYREEKFSRKHRNVYFTTDRKKEIKYFLLLV